MRNKNKLDKQIMITKKYSIMPVARSKWLAWISLGCQKSSNSIGLEYVLFATVEYVLNHSQECITVWLVMHKCTGGVYNMLYHSRQIGSTSETGIKCIQMFIVW